MRNHERGDVHSGVKIEDILKLAEAYIMGSGMDGRRDLRRLLELESRLGIRVSEAVDEAVSSQTRLSTKTAQRLAVCTLVD